jgi:hypothetical protein
VDKGAKPHAPIIRPCHSGSVASTFEAVLIGPVSVARLYSADLPQKDNLCGCFWASIALRAAGVEGTDGEPLDQDRVALAAGTILPEGDPAGFVPPGEMPRRDYTVQLPTVTDRADGGTAAPALAAAIEGLSGARLAVVPVAGPWSASSLVGLVRAAAEVSPEAVLVANVRTGRFWGTRPDPASLLAYLAGGEPSVPEHEWDTGHFVNVAALVTAGERALVVVRDSYRGLGWAGHHLQPADAFAAALDRGDGREGGVLCVAPAADAEGLGTRLRAEGFELRHWDNGTPAAVSPMES